MLHFEWPLIESKPVEVFSFLIPFGVSWILFPKNLLRIWIITAIIMLIASKLKALILFENRAVFGEIC